MKLPIIVVLSMGVGLSAMAGTVKFADELAPVLPEATEARSLNSQVEKAVQPVYPKEMLLAGVTGYVTLRATVNERGRVVGVKVLKADKEAFANAAVQALRKWQFVEAAGPLPEGKRHIEVPMKFMLAAN